MGITSIDVGGITCQYFAVGAGEPIVLLHCTGHSGRQWAELAAALQTDFEVIEGWFAPVKFASPMMASTVAVGTPAVQLAAWLQEVLVVPRQEVVWA